MLRKKIKKSIVTPQADETLVKKEKFFKNSITKAEPLINKTQTTFTPLKISNPQ